MQVHLARILALGAVLSFWTCARGADPYSTGEYDVTFFDVKRDDAHGPPFSLRVVTPNVSTGGYALPVLLFDTGLAGHIPNMFYTQFMEHVASHGFVAVGLQSIVDGINYKQFVEQVGTTINWIDENLPELYLHHGITNVSADVLGKLAIGGHSAGNHLAIEFMKGPMGNIVKAGVLSLQSMEWTHLEYGKSTLSIRLKS
jgi:hypothetical protein